VTPQAAPTTVPTLTLGQVGTRLGFALTAAFIGELGVSTAGRERAAVLFHEADFPYICAALVAHIQSIQAKAAHEVAHWLSRPRLAARGALDEEILLGDPPGGDRLRPAARRQAPAEHPLRAGHVAGEQFAFGSTEEFTEIEWQCHSVGGAA
jgi:hypothetical protein